MSEYIYDTDEQGGHWLTDEEIVRCRDCRFWHQDASHCTQFEFSKKFCYVAAKPDGFCAWGERRSTQCFVDSWMVEEIEEATARLLVEQLERMSDRSS